MTDPSSTNLVITQCFPLTFLSIVFFLPFFFYPSSSFLLIFFLSLFFFHLIFRKKILFSFVFYSVVTSIRRYLLHHIVFDVINRSVSTRRCLLRNIFFIVVSLVASSSSYLVIYVVLFVHLINTIFVMLRRATHHCISLYILVTAYHVVFIVQARCSSRISFLNPEPPNYRIHGMGMIICNFLIL